MIETQLSEAVTQLHLTAVETLNRLLKSETDPAELRRLLTIAVRVRHPATERSKPRLASTADAEPPESAASKPAQPQPATALSVRLKSHHRNAPAVNEKLNMNAAPEPVPLGNTQPSSGQASTSPPLSGRRP